MYSRLFQSVMLPPYDYIRGRSGCRHRGFLEKSQWWPAQRLRDFQWAELLRLLKHTYESVPYYREKYLAAGISLPDVQSWDDFANLPPLTREEVNKHRAELCSLSYKGTLLPDATGGSSGTPTRFFMTREAYDWRSAISQRLYSWAGYGLGERVLYLWGAPIGAQTGWNTLKNGAFHWLRREFIVNTFSQTDDFWAKTWRTAIALQPRFIVGYVSSLEGFIRHARHGQLRKLQAVVAAAEPVHTYFRERVEEVLRVPLFNTYGSREFMGIGGECDLHEGLHLSSENIVLEVEHPNYQEPSEFLVTDLHNYGMPFIRYKIGDMGLLDFTSCPCGRGLPKIHSIAGRTLDVLRGRDGRIVPGEFFPHLLKDIPEVTEFQVEQKSFDLIVLSVVLSDRLSQNSEQLLLSEIRKVFSDSTRVEVRRVDSIPLRASGKRRVTVGLNQ